MGFFTSRMDSRVKHGNDRERRGVMPPCVILLHGVIRHPSTKKVKGKKSKRRLKRALNLLIVLHLTRNKGDGFPCKICEIDAQISRVKHGNDRKRKVSHPCTPFFSSFGELFRNKGHLQFKYRHSRAAFRPLPQPIAFYSGVLL